MRSQGFILTKPVRNEQLVRELDRKRHHELLLVALTGFVLAVAVIIYAWPHFEMIRLGYRMEELRQEREVLVESRIRLELQRATESDPARIESIAKNELGMVYPDHDHMVVVEPMEVDDSPSSAGGRRASR